MEPEQKKAGDTVSEVIHDVEATVPTIEPEVAVLTPAPQYVKIPVATMKRYAVAFCLGLLLVALAFLFSKGYFIAATINGSPVSRFAVIGALEKQGGKEALQAIINERLVKAEIAKSNVTLDTGAVDARIALIEEQVKGQGGTLGEALTAEGMTLAQLTEQIETQLLLEKVLDEKLTVTDEEVTAFITENQVPAPEEAEKEAFMLQVKEQLKQQKFQTESQKWIAEVTAAAKIKYYVTY
jgi:foldase protein PrsA